MGTHLSEEDLVLHYYGEITTAAEGQATRHLAACGECRADYQRLQRVLTMIDEHAVAGPELPAHFERTVWARLEPGLRRQSGWSSRVVAWPGGLAWAAVVLVLVAAAFFAGRLLPRDAAPTQAASPADLRERILLVDLGEHLDQSQRVLVELVSAEGEDAVNISSERARAERLISASRLYRRTAADTGQAAVVELLDELERVLVAVAASPEELSAQDLDEVRHRIASQDLLFKVRALSTEVRERQRAPRGAPTRSTEL